MPAKPYIRPTKSALPPGNLLLIPQPPIAPVTPPSHVVDLMTAAGAAAFGAVWRGIEAKLVEGPALSDARPEFKTNYDVEPHAELLGFDDSAWPIIAPDDLGARRGGGMICFFWYRIKLTIPREAQGFTTDGTKAVFRVNIDDYAEVWVNGELLRTAGRPSAGCIQGFNMPNRLVLGDNIVHPGERFEVAVFAINGPISAAPANFLFVREAKVELFR
jgi:hypothetical protein